MVVASGWWRFNKAWLDLTGLGLPRAKLGLDWALKCSFRSFAALRELMGETHQQQMEPTSRFGLGCLCEVLPCVALCLNQTRALLQSSVSCCLTASIRQA